MKKQLILPLLLFGGVMLSAQQLTSNIRLIPGGIEIIERDLFGAAKCIWRKVVQNCFDLPIIAVVDRHLVDVFHQRLPRVSHYLDLKVWIILQVPFAGFSRSSVVEILADFVV